MVGKRRNSVKMQLKNIISQIAVTWKGVDTGHITQEQNSLTSSPVAGPAVPSLPSWRSPAWLLLCRPSPWP